MPPRRLLAVGAAVCALAGCGGSGSGGDGPEGPRSTPTASAPSAIVLPEGKTDLTVGPGLVQSPASFRPALTLRLHDAWTSVHRGGDAFDVGHPDPERDAPLVAVVIAATTKQPGAAVDAVAADGRRAGAHVTATHVAVGGSAAPAVDLSGGHGQVFASADRGIALDTTGGQRLRVIGMRLGSGSVLVLVLVPNGDRWDVAWRQAQALVRTLRPAA